ncbi:MAG: 2Fe-2S iron-sulfur cluster-binding protein, partial [Dehalococcoidales bacterium]|nr:2Fe-2S iron-sulfur cluster-binding protein [Dehalococcoidales bacterium]
MSNHTIDFQPIGRRGDCAGNETILECARHSGIAINSICGSAGTCGACRVRVISGKTSAPTRNEADIFTPQELKDGWRLACQTYTLGDCRIFIPPESMSAPQRLQVDGLEVSTAVEPVVRDYDVRMTPASLSDLTADAERILRVLNRQHHLRVRKVDAHVLYTMSSRVREDQWKCQVAVRGVELISVNSQ